MADEPNLYAGLADACTNARGWSGAEKPAAPTAEGLASGMIEFYKQCVEERSMPRYDVTFVCEACKCGGYATAIVEECPRCGHVGVLNGNRGHEGVLPMTRFPKEGE